MKHRKYLHVLLIFIAAKILILLSILYISSGPFGRNITSYNFRWVNKQFSMHVNSDVNYIVFDASSPEKNKISIFLDGKCIQDVNTDENKKEVFIDLTKYKSDNPSTLTLSSGYSFLAPNDNRVLSWRLHSFYINSINNNVLNQLSSVESDGIYPLETVSFSNVTKYDAIVNGLNKWDSGWYINILEHGYSFNKDLPNNQYNVAFYYMYPLVASFPYKVLNLSPQISLLLINNLATLISLLLMFKIGKELGMDDKSLLMSCALFMFNPFSVFLTAGYSEGIYILISAVTILLMIKGRYVASAAIGGMLSGTRSIGIFFALIYAIYYYIQKKPKFKFNNIAKMAVLLILSIWGKLAFMIFNLINFGTLFASENAQSGWNNLGNISVQQRVINLKNYMIIPFKNKFNLLDTSVVSITLVYFLVLIIIISTIKYRDKLSWFLIFWSSLQIILPLIIFGTKMNNPFSMGRYVLPMFPLYLFASKLLKDRVYISLSILSIFIFEMIIITMGYSQGLWIF